MDAKQLNGPDAMTLRYRLAPLLGFGARAWTRIAGEPQFQIAILHDVIARDFGQLERFIDSVQRERGFLSPGEIGPWLDRGLPQTPSNKPVLLTFDDGFASAVPIVRDILAPRGISAIFFVCPGLMDLPPTERDHAVVRNVFRGAAPATGVPRLMSWDELDLLRTHGQVIGAHGLNHIRLSTAGPGEAHDEIGGARARLERQYGPDIEWYAYAFGDINSISADALRIIRTHYKYCRTGIRGANGSRNLPGILNAQEVNLHTPAFYQRAVLDGALDIGYISARHRLAEYIGTTTTGQNAR